MSERPVGDLEPQILRLSRRFPVPPALPTVREEMDWVLWGRPDAAARAIAAVRLFGAVRQGVAAAAGSLA